jgi:hypothetical protein
MGITLNSISWENSVMTAVRPVAVLLVLVLCGAEVHAGIRYEFNYSQIAAYPAELRSERWGVAISLDALDAQREDNRPGRGAPEPKRMVVQALQDMRGSADEAPLETRRELVRIAEDAFAKKEWKEGKIGNIEYRIGSYSFTKWPAGGRFSPEQNRPSDGFMPFVAVRIVEKEKPK